VAVGSCGCAEYRSTVSGGGRRVAGQQKAPRGVGALVVLWTFADGIILGIPTIILAAVWNAVIVFIIGAAVYTLFNLGSCRWIDDKWDTWIVGTSFEQRLDKVRNGKRARRPVELIGRGSRFWFGLAAVLLSASQVVAPAANRLSPG
jgi:hypothetical protein